MYPKLFLKLSYFLVLFLPLIVWSNRSISINASSKILEESVTQLAIQDVQNLLEKACNCSVKINDEKADIQLNLPLPQAPLFDKIQHQEKDQVPYFYYPSTHFQWSSKLKNEQIHLDLIGDSYEGIAAALYALLQEKLGFRFYHPRKTIIPEWTTWQLPNEWTWLVKERFVKRGFHLHTMHPIELTEALLDQDFPDGLAMVKEYIDWLARNGQNYFEFNLLNSVDINEWISYAQKMVEYGHQRGVIMGLDISLHMIQQKAFMLYKNPPASFKSKTKQVLNTLDLLAKADWDVYNIELSSTEYTAGNASRREKLQEVILSWARDNQTKIMGRAHVVKHGDAVLNYKGNQSDNQLDSERGVMIHTVMFYEIAEEKAPVYGNENLRHMLDLMDKEQTQRETWYFPESAYWVTFDNSVPMLLLPYLSARLNDILLMEQKGITGHLTFSSGWEWSYWLIDWSIARWSWDYGKKLNPTESLELIFEDKNAVNGVNEVLSLQNEYLKDQELMRYIVAQTVTDEVPKMFIREFHPRPRWRYKDLFRKANQVILDSLQNEAIEPLQQFYEANEKVLKKMWDISFDEKQQQALWEELQDGLRITGLRAKHRHHCLNAIVEHRKSKLEKRNSNHLKDLNKAANIRQQALKIVKNREAQYAYDIPLLTTQRVGHTAYHFGYLYPVSNLHFWEREEGQIQDNRWGFGYKSIWHVRRIIGLGK